MAPVNQTARAGLTAAAADAAQSRPHRAPLLFQGNSCSCNKRH